MTDEPLLCPGSLYAVGLRPEVRSLAVGLLLLLFLCAGMVPRRATAAELTVEIEGLESSTGQVRIAVFDSRRAWLGTAAFAEVAAIDDRTCRVTFENVPPGYYGIAVFHDVNANGKNDRNVVGIPKEPYGFSNNQRVRFGPPKWEKSRFEVSEPATDVRIRVK